ncbi:MAG: beta-lactamase family protein [Leptospirales bacterium]|nr:beta-lactamase family protein [Leptospirales bacterium]
MTGLLLAALVQSIAGEGGQPAPIAESPWGLTLAAYVRDGGPQRGFARWARETQPELRSSDAVQRAATELDKHMAAATGGASIPMAAMAITREGATLYRSEHGLNVDSLFPVASVAKTFTAVAVLELADQGRLQLDDEIGRYLPELSFAQRPEGGRAVTIRHLLQHSSGLPYFARGGGTNLRCPHSGMALYIPSQYKPAGESHFYSNFNYNVLACLIERVSGERFDEYVTNQVLRPAGMDHSRLSPASNGAAGLNSTVADMGRFLSVVFDERSPRPLLSAQMRAEMIAPPAFLKGRVGRDEMYYALGVRVQYRHGHPAEVYHTGVWYNTFAEMRYFLTQGGAMATIANPPDFRSPLLYGFRDTNPLLGGRYLDAANQFVDSSSNMVGAAGY